MLSQLIWLRALTVGASLFCLVGLTWLVARTFAVGRKPVFNVARVNGYRGVRYAFTLGMMPWEKESAALHLPTFLGGIIYHAAIFLSFIYLFWIIILPAFKRSLLPYFRAAVAMGIASGVILLAKRVLKPHLRRLSCSDDFFANLMVDLFLMATLLHTYFPRLEPLLLSISIMLFVYIPVGKIRHCFFFFYTRIVFGVFFGRRGVYPHQPVRD